MRRPVVVQRRGPGLLGTLARTAVVAGTATAVAGSVSGAQKSRANEQAMMSDMAAPPASAPIGAGGLTAETMARLRQLAELQQQGILTPEEFAQQKARILGS